MSESLTLEEILDDFARDLKHIHNRFDLYMIVRGSAIAKLAELQKPMDTYLEEIDLEEIDIEILDLVNALNLGGVPTIGSCSGHGKQHGYILLKDERTLIILPPPLDKDYITRELQFNKSIKLKEGRMVSYVTGDVQIAGTRLYMYSSWYRRVTKCLSLMFRRWCNIEA
jgi:hypothetical protein